MKITPKEFEILEQAVSLYVDSGALGPKRADNIMNKLCTILGGTVHKETT